MGNPLLRFGLVGFGSSAALTGILWALLGAPPVLAWLGSINLVTLIIYRYDKAIAGSRATRVPERILHLLTLAGGTLGAAIAMWLFPNRHKTSKGNFVLVFFVILAIQIIIAGGYFWITR